MPRVPSSRSFLAALCLFAFSSSSRARAQEQAPVAAPATRPAVKAAARLRIASFNVENLFDEHDDPYTRDESTSPKSVLLIRSLARTIDAMDADILALQEVENRGVLELLNRALARPYAQVELIEGNDGRGIDVALMSRMPILRSTTHRLQRFGRHRFARDLVVFEVDTGHGNILVSPVHFKSKRSSKGDPGSDLWRTAEAKALIAALDEIRARKVTTPFVTLGDFNDEPDAATLAPLFERMKDGLAGIPAEQNWSYIYRGRKQRIDHLLYEGELQVVGARFVHDEGLASDHHPFVVEFAWPGKPKHLEGPKTDPRRLLRHRVRIEARDTPRLRQHLLKAIALHGKVVKIDKTRNGGHRLVRFSRDPRDSVTLFVPSKYLARFPDLDHWVGRELTVWGPLFRYRGQLEILLTLPTQLRK